MSTSSTDNSGSTSVDSLVEAIKTDEPQDSRACPHGDCHGSLSVVEDSATDSERVLCQTCRCDPDGVFHEPDEGHSPSAEATGLQATFWYPNGPPSSTFDPKGSAWDSQLEWKYGERLEYRVSGNVKMVGGFEEAWPQEKTSRDDSLI